MPFTLSHAVAVLPLRRVPGLRTLPLTALVIGSMTPDLGFLVPGLDRHLSHGFVGLFLFCLPAGWLVQLLFRHLLQAPLLNLAPRALERRLQAVLATDAGGMLRTSAALIVGAATHLVWDGITHHDGFIAAALPLLRTQVMMAGTRAVPLCDLLQHASSLGGLLALGGYWHRWLHHGVPPAQRDTGRLLWRLALLLVPACAAALALVEYLPAARVEHVVARAAGRMLEASALCVLSYAAWWHGRRASWRGWRRQAIRPRVPAPGSARKRHTWPARTGLSKEG